MSGSTGYHRSSNGSGSSRPRSRWGDRVSSGRQETNARPPPAAASGVSDEEALAALLSSAQQREQERSALMKDAQNNRKRGRFSSDQNNNNKRGDHHGSGGGNGRREQNLAENDSYYGRAAGGDQDPPRRRQRRDEEDRGPAKVEPEDDDEGHDKKESAPEDEKKPPAHKPNFGLSGALVKDAGGGGNVYKGVVLKFQEPPEARAPNTLWRFYVFKGKEMLETLHVSKQSAYLCGRNQDICDIYMAHPSLSSQHAVLQYRALPHKETGRLSCQPYIMDLESTNGTFLNGVRLDPARYYQLKKGDVLTFGASKREYVLLTENSTALR